MDTTTNTQTAFTVNQILDRFEADYIPHELAPRTQIDYGRHVRVLRKWYGDRIASELKPRDFGPFLDVRRGRFQRARQLAVLSSAFTEATSTWFMIERNVLRDVKRPKGKPRDRLILDDEFKAVREMAPRTVKLAMQLALLTGQRQGDLLAMKWEDVINMEIHIYQGKTGKRLAIEVSGHLEEVLDECWMLPKRGPYVLSKRDGDRYTSEGFRAMWQRTIRRYVRRGGTRFTFHDIRALCATKCPTMEMAMHLLGHSNISMTRRVYRRGIERVKPLTLK